MTEPEAEARSTLDTILEQERQKVADLRAVLSSQMEPGAGLRAPLTCNSTDADPRGTASSSFHVPDFSPALLVPSQHSTLVLDVECIRYAKLVLASVADLRKALPYDSTVAVLSAEYVASLPPEAAFPDEAVILGVASIPNESNQVALIRGTFMDDVALALCVLFKTAKSILEESPDTSTNPFALRTPDKKQLLLAPTWKAATLKFVSYHDASPDYEEYKVEARVFTTRSKAMSSIATARTVPLRPAASSSAPNTPLDVSSREGSLQLAAEEMRRVQLTNQANTVRSAVDDVIEGTPLPIKTELRRFARACTTKGASPLSALLDIRDLAEHSAVHLDFYRLVSSAIENMDALGMMPRAAVAEAKRTQVPRAPNEGNAASAMSHRAAFPRRDLNFHDAETDESRPRVAAAETPHGTAGRPPPGSGPPSLPPSAPSGGSHGATGNGIGRCRQDEL